MEESHPTLKSFCVPEELAPCGHCWGSLCGPHLGMLEPLQEQPVNAALGCGEQNSKVALGIHP